MRHRLAALGCAALLLAGASACGGANQKVSAAGRTRDDGAATDPEQPPAICADLERITGLPEKLALASNAGNLQDLRTALTAASKAALEAGSEASGDIHDDLQTMADDLDSIDSTLTEAHPTSISDGAVATAMDDIQSAYQGAAPLRVAEYRTTTCG